MVMRTFGFAAALACALALFVATAAHAGHESEGGLADVIARGLDVKIEPRTEEGYLAAAKTYKDLLAELEEIDYEKLSLDDQVDYDLFEAHAKTKIFEYEDLQLFKLVPVNYLRLGATSGLFLRPEANSTRACRAAIEEMKTLDEHVAAAKENLTTPAKTWTENALYTAWFAQEMLKDVGGLKVEDAALKGELTAAAKEAAAAVDDYVAWMEADLLPRSTRDPTWTVEQIDAYQIGHEMLDDYPSTKMLEIAEKDARKTMREMQALAKKIHPSGDLRTVWENMKDEAPPWSGVLPMSQSFVDMASDWLRNEGDHVVTIPDYLDYGARITTPMARRILSFGGATRGPDVAGRQSGYYVLTPLESRLSEEEKASRIRSYNPYWTHVISYHEWLGHNVQIAAANEHVDRPIRHAFNSIYLSQAWSFYLEKLLPDEGYYDDKLDYLTALKTEMGRLQMRMWRDQRIITKVKMAMGEMTFDEAVEAYIDEIGMEPTNALIEVQRDSQSPSPPGREIIGELVILDMREEYERRMGPHYSMRRFHDQFLTYGAIPFKQIRRLMFE